MTKATSNEYMAFDDITLTPEHLKEMKKIVKKKIDAKKVAKTANKEVSDEIKILAEQLCVKPAELTKVISLAVQQQESENDILGAAASIIEVAQEIS